MPCEMCGKEAPLKTVLIEGTEMQVCSSCAEYGEEIDTSSSSPKAAAKARVQEGMKRRSKRNKPRDVYEDNPEALAEDYGERIRKAREKTGLTIEELSDKINEKRSTVAKSETYDHHPSDALVQKLERFLDVELMIEPEATQRVKGASGQDSGPVTIGDLLKEEMDES